MFVLNNKTPKYIVNRCCIVHVNVYRSTAAQIIDISFPYIKRVKVIKNCHQLLLLHVFNEMYFATPPSPKFSNH